MKEVAVYIFLGFLDSGKTTFIKETLEDERMEKGKKTLLLACEEGDVEYEPDKFAVKDVKIETLESVDDLSLANLTYLSKKYNPDQVFIEFNGAWVLDQLFDAMPENWVVYQMLTFFDATTFLTYNRNMRQLVFDKIQATQMVVFNRFKGEMQKMDFHKIVRGVSRQVDIIYEYLGGKIERDEIEDPLPFDVNAPVVEIADRDYGFFYRDVVEKLPEYVGKTVKFKGQIAVPKKIEKGSVLVGRHVMTCCEADIDYDGFVLKTLGTAHGLKTQDWVVVQAKMIYEYNSVYGQKGPVLLADSIEKCDAPDEIVATFY